jgi:prophage regulatory protein
MERRAPTETARAEPAPQTEAHTARRLLRLREVLARIPLKRSTIYARVAAGTFPKPVPLGSPHAVAWLESEIDAWISRQIRVARSEQRDDPLSLQVSRK